MTRRPAARSLALVLTLGAAFGAAGCAMRSVNLDVPTDATDVATIEWRWNIERYLRLYSIDQFSHDPPGFGTAHYRLHAGHHTLRFVYVRPVDVYEYKGPGQPARQQVVTSGNDVIVVEFDAEAGHQYRVDHELSNYREPTVETGGRGSSNLGSVEVCVVDRATDKEMACTSRDLMVIVRDR